MLLDCVLITIPYMRTRRQGDPTDTIFWFMYITELLDDNLNYMWNFKEGYIKSDVGMHAYIRYLNFNVLRPLLLEYWYDYRFNLLVLLYVPDMNNRGKSSVDILIGNEY